jgi:hypothetical protein
MIEISRSSSPPPSAERGGAMSYAIYATVMVVATAGLV